MYLFYVYHVCTYHCIPWYYDGPFVGDIFTIRGVNLLYTCHCWSSVQMLGQVGIHAVHHRRDIVVVLVVGRLTLTLTLTLGYKIIIAMSPLR